MPYNKRPTYAMSQQPSDSNGTPWHEPSVH